MLYHNSMKIKFCPYHFYIFFILLFFLFISCSSQTQFEISGNAINLSNNTELNNEFFDLVNDYDVQNGEKTHSEITKALYEEILSSLSDYCTIYNSNNKEQSFQIDARDFNKPELILFINKLCPENNKILYYDSDNILRLNINVDNYQALSIIIPALNNETLFAYTAAYNRDISKEDYKTLISYAVSPKISAVMDECIINICINDDNGTRSCSFSITDFMLLHTPITL